jgi:hypothetical protein
VPNRTAMACAVAGRDNLLASSMLAALVEAEIAHG